MPFIIRACNLDKHDAFGLPNLILIRTKEIINTSSASSLMYLKRICRAVLILAAGVVSSKRDKEGKRKESGTGSSNIQSRPLSPLPSEVHPSRRPLPPLPEQPSRSSGLGGSGPSFSLHSVPPASSPSSWGSQPDRDGGRDNHRQKGNFYSPEPRRS
jgi:hypothetical protein